MTLADELRQEGEILGAERGRQEAKLSVARNLLDQGLTIFQIAAATELKTTEIERLRLLEN